MPAQTTFWSSRRSCVGSHSYMVSLRSLPANSAVQGKQLVLGERVGAGQQLTHPLVIGGGLALLLVRQCQDPKGEDFVDLGTVEQVSGTFGGHLRIVVQNDRGDQHRIALTRVADQDRPAADVLASRRQ